MNYQKEQKNKREYNAGRYLKKDREENIEVEARTLAVFIAKEGS